ANSFTSNSGGTCIRRSDSSGVRYGWPEGFVFTKPNSFWAKSGDALQATATKKSTRRAGRCIGNSRREKTGRIEIRPSAGGSAQSYAMAGNCSSGGLTGKLQIESLGSAEGSLCRGK